MSSCENSEAKCTDTKGKLLGQVATLTSEVSRLESECSSLQDLISKLVQEKEADRDLEQLGKISSVLKRTVAVISRVGTSVCETHTSSGKVADEHLKHSEKEDQNCYCCHTATTSTDTKSPTVQRILDLRNEMESTSHLEHFSLQKFHPDGWVPVDEWAMLCFVKDGVWCCDDSCHNQVPPTE
ncbi:hypothetical protein O3P69_010042 [Scylla paramamosain]|uniref:Uncharacterized protein n=1 Tax=Scylla paramamosain TaxID=85552 RepID=A0AAW0SPJ4_SCYPA